jgi:hypothetical protein
MFDALDRVRLGNEKGIIIVAENKKEEKDE